MRELETSELEKIRVQIGDDEWFENEGRPGLSREIFEEVALAQEFVEFLDAAGGRALAGALRLAYDAPTPRAACANG